LGLSKNAAVYNGHEVELVAISTDTSVINLVKCYMESTGLNIPGCYAFEAVDAEGASRSLDIAGNTDADRRIDLLIDENNVEGRLVSAAVVTLTLDPFHQEQTVHKIETHLTLVQVTL
jgi:hypothetical protein